MYAAEVLQAEQRMYEEERLTVLEMDLPDSTPVVLGIQNPGCWTELSGEVMNLLPLAADFFEQQQQKHPCARWRIRCRSGSVQLQSVAFGESGTS